MFNVKIENDIRNEKKKNELKSSRLEQVSDWEKNNDVSIVSTARMRKKRRDDCHLSELSLSRVDTNLSENQNCSDIWKKDYSSLLKSVEWVENMIETFTFKLIRTCEKMNDWLIDRRQIEMTIKFSTATTTRYWWINDFEYKNYSRNWYVKNIDNDVDLIHVQIITWMMLSFVEYYEVIDYLEAMKRKMSIKYRFDESIVKQSFNYYESLANFMSITLSNIKINFMSSIYS